MAVRVGDRIHFRSAEAFLALRLAHVDGRRFRIHILGLKYFADTVDHQRQLLRGIDVDLAVPQRVVTLARNGDEEVTRLRESERESAGRIGLGFQEISRCSGVHRYASGLNRRLVFIDDSAVQSYLGAHYRACGEQADNQNCDSAPHSFPRIELPAQPTVSSAAFQGSREQEV